MGSVTDTPPLPYWQVNVPPAEREAECPEFLRSLSAKDEGIIGTPDAEYRVASWHEVQQIIADNRLDAFRRVPSQLRRYLEYNWKLRRDHGSVMKFVLSERLGWDVVALPSSSLPNGDYHTAGKAEQNAAREPFANDDDIKILWNDWPYGIDPKIVHLVVWTKFDLEEDPVTTDLTDRARRQIDDYVADKFGRHVARDRVSHFPASQTWDASSHR
ncbi:uncharacterized protein B0I36DRAFT_317879 [Microdochium trichocladiopsis]|uniref:Uncharacterized protein n=1 Tax=Microdochium trichocladiopsis TaxID=1682393 RepID=A0A9P8YC42_9PEZI|nr:uncharacterized protein B0I36DRAFT_317879 [Microdochium trichocladiopsis]KAH7035215.1 hypothetical protein B0I36DRAFT_317879 [Microdochium trichocladiopsis]